jgi:hypothetical protein
MFRDRIFEWGRLLDNLFNAWGGVKVVAKAKSGSLLSGVKKRTGPNIDPRRAELNRIMGRAYIQPTQFNR